MAWTKRSSVGGKWQGKYRDTSGRECSAGSFVRKGDALKAAQDKERDVRLGINVHGGRMRLGVWAEEVFDGLARRRRPSGLNRDRSHLDNHVLPTFGDCRLDSIRRADIQRWVNGLSAKDLAPRTVRDIYAVLRLVLKRAAVDKLITESPCHYIDLPRIPKQEPRFLDYHEVDRLADAIHPDYRALVFVLAYGGLRWQEAAALRVQDVDLLHGRLSVVGTIERDGAVERYVPEAKTSMSRRTIDIPAPLVSALRAHIEENPTRSGFVLEAPEGGFMKYSNSRRRFWMPAVHAAGLAVDATEDSAGLGFHELRHTAAALLIDQGADPLTVQQYLGHDDIKTTLSLYGHLFPRRGKAMAVAFGDAIEAARAAYVLPESA